MIHNLVFQGGSVKGVAYIGALEELEKYGVKRSQIKRVAGTSAGAITALLIALGYSKLEIRKLMTNLDFKQFLDESGFETRKKILKGVQAQSKFSKMAVIKPVSPVLAYRLHNAFGIYDGEYFREFAEKVIFDKARVKHLTFRELHEKALQDDNFKDLYVVGVNISTGMTEVFSWETTPDAIISDAVRISMSIPFIFKPHMVYKKDQGLRIVDAKKHLYVDGGLTNNYPIDLFDQVHYVGSSVSQEGQSFFNEETLGFKLVDKKKKDFFEEISDAPVTEVNSLITFSKAIFSSLLDKQDSDHAKGMDKKRTVYIDTVGVGMLDFGLTATQKERLIVSGREGVKQYFLRSQKEVRVSSNQFARFGQPPEMEDDNTQKKFENLCVLDYL